MKHKTDTGLHIYSMGYVMKKTGLSARQIRYYEEVDLIKPRRTPGNQRRFSQEDINRLLQIKELLEQNLTVEDIRTILATGESEQREETNSPEMVFARLPVQNQSRAQRQLTSLYPVSDTATLQRILHRRNRIKESGDS